MNNIINTHYNNRTNIQTCPQQITFKGVTPIEKLGKDTFVGVRNTLIQETAFFREPELIEFVKQYITTTLKDKHKINIIDGACSKGYETYTIAMMLDDVNKEIKILGLDIGKEAINDAQKGIYFVKQIHGNEDTVFAYKFGLAAYNDDYLAFSPETQLSAKEKYYKKKFNEFFEAIPNYKEKRTLFEYIREKLFPRFTPHFETKAFKIKPEKAEKCQFISGDIRKLDRIVPENSADVLLFRNALYHMTTQEAGMGLKIPLPDKIVIPVVKDIVKQIDKAIAHNGLFVIGEHKSDHTLTAGKTLYKELENRNFTPVFYNPDGSMAYIWKKK